MQLVAFQGMGFKLLWYAFKLKCYDYLCIYQNQACYPDILFDISIVKSITLVVDLSLYLSWVALEDGHWRGCNKLVMTAELLVLLMHDI
jgi:hypothetical protein